MELVLWDLGWKDAPLDLLLANSWDFVRKAEVGAILATASMELLCLKMSGGRGWSVLLVSNSQMLEIKQMRWKTSLAEQGSSLGNKVKKEDMEAGSDDVGRIQRCCYPLWGENLCSKSSAEVEAAGTIEEN